MLKSHYLAVAFAGSTVVPLMALWFLKRRFNFDGMLPLTLFSVAPAAGVVGFLLVGFGRFGIVTALFGYFLGVAFFGAGWAALLGVFGWKLGLEIQARANFDRAILFLIGGSAGTVCGVIFLPLYCYLVGVPSDFIALWILPGALSGAIAGLIVASYVPAASENRVPETALDSRSRW